MSAPDGSPCGMAMAGLNQLLDSEAVARPDARTRSKRGRRPPLRSTTYAHG